MSNATLKKTQASNKVMTNEREQHRHQLIAAEAYSLAQERKFSNGNETDDWYAAELKIDALLTR
ncbi:MAG: DUF2934 domain-containing protein [Paraglaciecola sp.]|uniref:DUF2934 domain-containing protein n=1 Tax=Pseudomonadati TaxID=3379134 RepID=UPI00273E52FB|nr:DUF2934 domain-containing protein [Paraglaciecola sp.]MDP5032189.1 DUF2934 domain-containing protein [Paraglaciecola sp.]MDP5133085.1 DUF2934 domain-containing protein [Paraglaciecola sp.]